MREDPTFLSEDSNGDNSFSEFHRFSSYLLPSDELSGTVSGTSETLRKYLPYTSSALNVFENVNEGISSIENPDVKRFVVELMAEFLGVLAGLAKSEETLVLPSIVMIVNDDKSVLLEWIFTDFRIGFLIYEATDRSVWYIVTNQNLEEFSKTGYLTHTSLRSTLDFLLQYALRNS
ncbi:MAG TPA: hypothetical protein PL103_07715 [Saccharofermentans sp.]|nr:hypothetical protein [Saccharofermentans sp.]